MPHLLDMSASFGILKITTESMESQEVTKIYITCNSLVESKGMYDLSLDLLTSYSMCEVFFFIIFLFF